MTIFIAVRVWNLSSARSGPGAGPQFDATVFTSSSAARDFMREQGYREGDPWLDAHEWVRYEDDELEAVGRIDEREI